MSRHGGTLFFFRSRRYYFTYINASEHAPEGRIEKARIPDDDVIWWTQTLREGGCNDQEIDLFLTGLNIEYFRAKMTKNLKEGFEKGVRVLEEGRKKNMTSEEREKLLEIFRSFLSKKGHR